MFSTQRSKPTGRLVEGKADLLPLEVKGDLTVGSDPQSVPSSERTVGEGPVRPRSPNTSNRRDYNNIEKQLDPWTATNRSGRRPLRSCPAVDRTHPILKSIGEKGRDSEKIEEKITVYNENRSV